MIIDIVGLMDQSATGDLSDQKMRLIFQNAGKDKRATGDLLDEKLRLIFQNAGKDKQTR